MNFKIKSTYAQLTIMFALLLIINFMAIILTLRHLSFTPAATQFALLINNQVKIIEPLLKGKSYELAQKEVSHAYPMQLISLTKKPQANEFPQFKFYQVLLEQLIKDQNMEVLLEESNNHSKIWLKPAWLNEYWIGISFQPFVQKITRLFRILFVVLFLLSSLAAYFFSRYMLKPFRHLAQLAVDLVEQNSHHKEIKISGTKEVQEIAELVKTSAQKIQHLNKEKEMFLAGVSHDLRTPLARMRLQAEFLNDEEGKEALVQEIEEMDQIIGDFVTYVKSGSIESFKKTNLVEIINETIKPYAQNNNPIIYDSSCKENAQIWAKVKPLSLKRMLTNIYDNAIKYGEPPITVKIDSNQNTYTICVIDQGKGIDDKQLSSIFDPFVMAQNTDNQYGSGLGLSIVKKLAEQNNAHVYAKNLAEGGFLVCIEFKEFMNN